MPEDPRQVGIGLDVVDQRGAAEQAALGRIRRAQAGNAAASLDRLQERGFLAADEGPGPLEHVELEIQPPPPQTAEYVALPQAVQRRVHALDGKGIFRPHVHDGLRGAHRVGRDRHALDDPVGERFHEHAVHEGPRVAFVAVANHVLGEADRLPHDVPLHARGKTGAAPPPQSAPADFLDHLCRRYLLQATRQPGEAAAGQVFIEVQGVAAAEMFGGDMDLRPEESRHVRLRGTHGARGRRDPRDVVQQAIEGPGRKAAQPRGDPPRAKVPRDEGLGRRLGDVRVDLGRPAGEFDFDRRRLLAHQPAGHPLDAHRHVGPAEGLLHGAEGPVAAPRQAAGIEADPDLALGLAVADQAGPNRRLAVVPAGLDAADQLGDPVGGLRAVDVVSAAHHRGQRAATDAEDLLDGVLSGGVGIVLAADVEIIAEHVVDALGAFDVTGGAVADADQVPAHGAVPELRVERRDAGDLRQGNLAVLGHPPQGLPGQIAVMTLQDLQDGQNPVWIASQAVKRLIDKGEVELHQRAPDRSDPA